MKCQYCKAFCVKVGRQKNGSQKFRCKTCLKYQQAEYQYQAYVMIKRRLIVPMIINNCGFSGTASVLGISYNTVSRIILTEAAKCKPPQTNAGGIYEVDEMEAYHKTGVKQIWAVYAIERKSKNVIGINVGRRTSATLRKTINAVLSTSPEKIYSDYLATYKKLIPEIIHKRLPVMLTNIERLHRTARNRLKMLNRGSLAFVRKEMTLLSCLKLLFWWHVETM